MEYKSCRVGAQGVASTNPRQEEALQGPGIMPACSVVALSLSSHVAQPQQDLSWYSWHVCFKWLCGPLASQESQKRLGHDIGAALKLAPVCGNRGADTPIPQCKVQQIVMRCNCCKRPSLPAFGEGNGAETASHPGKAIRCRQMLTVVSYWEKKA